MTNRCSQPVAALVPPSASTIATATAASVTVAKTADYRAFDVPSPAIYPTVKGGDKVIVFDPVKIAANHYFMMGANRVASYDSRMHGSVPRTSIVGKVVRVVPASS